MTVFIFRDLVTLTFDRLTSPHYYFAVLSQISCEVHVSLYLMHLLSDLDLLPLGFKMASKVALHGNMNRYYI